MKKGKDSFYAKYIKRILDFTLSLIALIVLSPILLLLTVVGAIAMKGNPFFIQKRPGKIDPKTGKERIFSLIKFRTMDNRRDASGNLLSDGERLNVYGRWCRCVSAAGVIIGTKNGMPYGIRVLRHFRWLEKSHKCGLR